MTHRNHDTFFAVLTPLNKVLLAVFAVLVCGVGFLAFLDHGRMEKRSDEENALKKKIGDLAVLEQVHGALVKENEVVEKEMELFPRDRTFTRYGNYNSQELKALALKHRMVPGWVDEIRYSDSGAVLSTPGTGFSMTGSFSGFLAFLRKLVSDPSVGGVSLIQIHSEFELLDIMINIDRPSGRAVHE